MEALAGPRVLGFLVGPGAGTERLRGGQRRGTKTCRVRFSRAGSGRDSFSEARRCWGRLRRGFRATFSLAGPCRLGARWPGSLRGRLLHDRRLRAPFGAPAGVPVVCARCFGGTSTWTSMYSCAKKPPRPPFRTRESPRGASPRGRRYASPSGWSRRGWAAQTVAWPRFMTPEVPEPGGTPSCLKEKSAVPAGQEVPAGLTGPFAPRSSQPFPVLFEVGVCRCGGPAPWAADAASVPFVTYALTRTASYRQSPWLDEPGARSSP